MIGQYLASKLKERGGTSIKVVMDLAPNLGVAVALTFTSVISRFP